MFTRHNPPYVHHIISYYILFFNLCTGWFIRPLKPQQGIWMWKLPPHYIELSTRPNSTWYSWQSVCRTYVPWSRRTPWQKSAMQLIFANLMGSEGRRMEGRERGKWRSRKLQVWSFGRSPLGAQSTTLYGTSANCLLNKTWTQTHTHTIHTDNTQHTHNPHTHFGMRTKRGCCHSCPSSVSASSSSSRCCCCCCCCRRGSLN